MEIFFIHFIALYTFLHLNFLFIQQPQRFGCYISGIWYLHCVGKISPFLYWTKWISQILCSGISKRANFTVISNYTQVNFIFIICGGSKEQTSSGASKRLIVASLEFLIHLAIKFRLANSSYRVEQHKDLCNISSTVWYHIIPFMLFTRNIFLKFISTFFIQIYHRYYCSGNCYFLQQFFTVF